MVELCFLLSDGKNGFCGMGLFFVCLYLFFYDVCERRVCYDC